MKKIYLIREKSSKFGGAEVYLSRLAKALEMRGIEHQVIHSIFPKFLPSWLRIVLFNLQVCLTKGEKFYFSLERIVCPDVYRAGDGVHKVFLSVERKSKLNPLHPIYLFLEKRCFNNAKRIIANSKMIRDEIVETYGVNINKIDVVYNGVELKTMDFDSAYSKLSQEFDLKPNIPVILYVGSGFKRKGVEEFLQIVSQLRSDYQAFIVGKEKKLAYYRQLASRLNVSDRVVFTGPRADVEDFYTISDILLFPTHYEPFSNVVLEAMNFGNVVFTTRQNGAFEILDSDCIMSSPKDTSVVERIDALLQNRNWLEAEKERNLQQVKQFSVQENLLNTLKTIKHSYG